MTSLWKPPPPHFSPIASSKPSASPIVSTATKSAKATIEDQGGIPTRNLIRTQFGNTVVSLIDGCTESATHPKPPWQERKQRHLAQLQNASPAIRRITLADKLHNARSLLADYEILGEALWQRFAGGRECTLWYYQQVIQILSAQDGGKLGKTLIQAVEQLTALSTTTDQFSLLNGFTAKSVNSLHFLES
jgi:(p)ppGpp synthase/HD superfamily hydrolase